jgi:hypothetical protein
VKARPPWSNVVLSGFGGSAVVEVVDGGTVTVVVVVERAWVVDVDVPSVDAARTRA